MASEAGKFDPAILLVEDDPLTREELGELLRSRFKRLHLAENGEQGITIYNELRPDIVITDILMPLMNGIDMARAIQKIDPGAQIVLITAYSEIDGFIDSKHITAHYVWKPVDMDELFNTLEECRKNIIAGEKNRIS